MANRIEVKVGDDWVPVGGALLHLFGRRFRVIITSNLSVVAGLAPETVDVRVNGVIGREVKWSLSPQDSTSRGYGSIELTLDSPDE